MTTSKKKPDCDFSTLEPIVDQLLSGSGDAKEIARCLETLGYPGVFDPTEQLRLTLRLLETNNARTGAAKKRAKSTRPVEIDLG